MNITYFHRNPSSGYSIGKVSRTYISEIEKTEQVMNVYMPCAKADPWSVIRNMWYAYKHRNKDGINHIVGDVHYLALVLPTKKTILTVHDIGYLDVNKGVKMMWNKIIWHYLPYIKLHRIVCISEETRCNILKNILDKPDKMIVIPNAVDPCFQPLEHVFNTVKPRILCIGTAPHKNLFRTIEALKGISCHLRIVGKMCEDLIQCLKNNQIDFSNINNLSDKEIVSEYENCDLVSFVSWFEGFGMPIIEAQAVGRPVLTSLISPLKEVAGDGAVLVDPYNVDSIREGFISIINNEKLRNNLVMNGLKNIILFRSKNVAEKYLKIYRTIMLD